MSTSTEILERGPSSTEADHHHFHELLESLLPGVEAVVLAGSVPDGATQGFLDGIIRRVRTYAHRLFVDSSGPALATLLEHGPDLIKPNIDEMQALMGRSATVHEQIDFARTELIGRTIPEKGQVLLTLGKDGAVLVSRDLVLRAYAPDFRPVNTVGCGDALLAGFVDSWLAGQGDVNALRHAVACGSAAALSEVAGEIDLADRDQLITDVELSLLDPSGASIPLR